MTETVDRRCMACKLMITINRHNIADVVQFQNKYYHYNCFHEMATKKACSKRGKPEMWKDALSRMSELTADAKRSSEQYFVKQDFNDWLLSRYDIPVIPSQFWQRIADLEQGIYGHMKCKPISTKTLFEAWEWGWKNLNDINIRNKNANKGPKNDEQRLVYDMSILIKKIPDFLKYKAKHNSVTSELEQQATYVEVDMSKIGQQKRETKKSISNIFDDLYVE